MGIVAQLFRPLSWRHAGLHPVLPRDYRSLRYPARDPLFRCQRMFHSVSMSLVTRLHGSSPLSPVSSTPTLGVPSIRNTSFSS
jgi:hypothetical protein